MTKYLHNSTFGTWGEQRARAFLVEKGWPILATNFRFSHGEIDIVAQDGEVIVFVEVKTRSTDEFGHPSQAVTHKKLQSLTQTAIAFLKQRHLTNDFRFDIISVLPDQIEHFENVTL